MLHPLAQTEVRKLVEHGVHGLTYDEVASLQELALAVDAAVRSEGLPVGSPRPVRLDDATVLWAPTCAAMAAIERVSPWLDNEGEETCTQALAWILAHGRHIAALEATATDRRTFLAATRKWASRLPVTSRELADAVQAVFAAQAQEGFRVDEEACERVMAYATAQGDEATAEAVERLLVRLKASRGEALAKPRAMPAWGTLTARLAALTGCPPGAWALTPSADAIDAYAARFDFEALRAGANAEEPAKRAQREALRALFATTDAIARAHRAKEATP